MKFIFVSVVLALSLPIKGISQEVDIKELLRYKFANSSITIISARFGSETSDKALAQISENTTLITELESLFERSRCSLPSKIKSKLSNGGKVFIPESLKKDVSSEASAKMQAYPGSSARHILHAAVLKNAAGDIKTAVYATRASTYKSFDPLSALDTQNFDNYYYMLDCSGYLTAALESSLTAGISLKNDAKLSLNESSVMTYVKGLVISPLASAMGAYAGGAITSEEKFSIIYALALAAKQEGAADSDILSAPDRIRMVWTSISENTSLNGKTDLLSNASVGAGIATVVATGASGASVTKKIALGAYRTYVFEGKEKSTSISFKNIINQINDLAGKPVHQEITTSTAGLVRITQHLPAPLCELQWIIRKADADETILGTVTSVANGNYCNLMVDFDPSVPQDLQRAFKIKAQSPFAAESYFIISVKR